MHIKYFGMRTVKTGLAVLASSFLATIIPGTDAFNITFASVICIETSMVSSLKAGFNRVIGTFMGAMSALAMLYLPLSNPVRMSVGVMLVIYACNRLGIKRSIGISASVVILIIAGRRDVTPLEYTMRRILDTLMGIGVATFINLAIAPPDLMRSTRETFRKFRDTASATISEMLFLDLDEGLSDLTCDLDAFKASVKALSEEIPYLRRYDVGESRYLQRMERQAERVYIHLESLAMMGRSLPVTMENNVMLRNLIGIDFPERELPDEKTVTGETAIFNYNLKKLLTAYSILMKEYGKDS